MAPLPPSYRLRRDYQNGFSFRPNQLFGYHVSVFGGSPPNANALVIATGSRSSHRLYAPHRQLLGYTAIEQTETEIETQWQCHAPNDTNRVVVNTHHKINETRFHRRTIVISDCSCIETIIAQRFYYHNHNIDHDRVFAAEHLFFFFRCSHRTDQFIWNWQHAIRQFPAALTIIVMMRIDWWFYQMIF